MFTRVELKDAQAEGGKFFEVPQVHWVNPRQLHRRLVRMVEERGYSIEPEDTQFELVKEAIGEKSGIVTARVAASRSVPGFINFTTKPYRTMGLVALVLGLIFIPGGAVLSGTAQWLLLGLGVTGLGLGVAGLLYKQPAEMPANAKIWYRILMEGEVTERTVEEQGATATNLMAQLSIAAGTLIVQQADGTEATAADREGFKATFTPEMPYGVSPFGQVWANESPFWSHVDKETADAWAELESVSVADFDMLRDELEFVTGNIHDVSPASVVDFMQATRIDEEAEPEGASEAPLEAEPSLVPN